MCVHAHASERANERGRARALKRQNLTKLVHYAQLILILKYMRIGEKVLREVQHFALLQPVCAIACVYLHRKTSCNYQPHTKTTQLTQAISINSLTIRHARMPNSLPISTALAHKLTHANTHIHRSNDDDVVKCVPNTSARARGLTHTHTHMVHVRTHTRTIPTTIFNFNSYLVSHTRST